MLEWILDIHPNQYNWITNGSKTIDVRIHNPDKSVNTNYNLMTEEEHIRFRVSDCNSLVSEKYPIMFVTHYNSIRDMFNHEDLKSLFPHIDTIEEGINLYYEFSDYKKREQEYGVYAIGLGEPV